MWPFSSNFQAGRNPVITDSESGELTPDSNYNVGKTEKLDKVEVNTATPDVVAKINTARLNEGILQPNTILPATVTPADYYRRGRLKPTDPALTANGGSVMGSTYDYSPRFIQDPEHEEIASLRLIGKIKSDSNSEDVDLIPPYSKFFLESYQEGHMERSQVVETFGEFYAFFFGERPPVYTFSGTLLNTKDINWKEDFMFYYDNFLRGTKAVEYQAKVVLTYNLSQVEGYILGVNTQAQASNDKGVGVSFQMLVTKRRSMRLSIDFGIIEDSGKFNDDTSITSMITQGISDGSVSSAYVHAIDVNSGATPPAEAKALSPEDIKDKEELARANAIGKEYNKEITIAQGKVKISPIGG